MKIETFPLDDHQVKIVVELDAEQMEAGKRRAARKIANRTKIPGFRPGKAPYDIVLRYAGEGAVTEEAIELLVDEIYPKVLDEEKIKPAAPGSLESVDSVAPPKFTFKVPLEPTVDLGKYQSVRIPYEWQAPGEEKVEQSIQELRQMHATTETVERPIQEGDFVMTDIVGHKAKTAEGKAALVDRPGFPVFIRPEGRKEDWPFEGFSRQLIGLAPGESKTIAHKYPKDYEDDEVKGQTVNYVITINTIRGVTLPELNDEFAKTVGSFESLAALRDVVRANLAQQSKAEYDNDYYTNVVDKIKEGATIKYPPQVLEHEVEHVLEDLEQRLASQGMDMEVYIKSREMEREKYIEEEIRPIAVRRLERGLIMEQISKAENIKISDEALQSSFQQTYSEVASSQQFQKNLRGKQPSREVVNAIAMESAGRAATQLTLDRLKEIATGEAARKAKEEKKAAEKKAAEEAAGTEGEAEAKPKKTAKSASAAATKKPVAAKATAKKPAEAESGSGPKKRTSKKTEPKTE